MDAYKKEVWFTVIMSLVFIICGHLGLVFSIFPVDGYLFGFPIMYIVPILVGWFGILGLTVISKNIGNHIDDAIEAENQARDKQKEGVM